MVEGQPSSGSNVPAGYQQLRVLTEALEHLPCAVDKVMLRSDAAGYQHELLRYCAEGRDERFGVIEFAVGLNVTPEFRRAVSEVAEQDWHAPCSPPQTGRHLGRDRSTVGGGELRTRLDSLQQEEP